jgi:hypothetical protein
LKKRKNNKKHTLEERVKLKIRLPKAEGYKMGNKYVEQAKDTLRRCSWD